MKTTRAFTLIELMVVISIISMLASVVLASLKPIRAQAQDAKRKQEIHSIDLAIQQYIADKGYPPDLGSCAALVPYAGGLSGCVAVSTDGLSGFPANQNPTTNWGKLAQQLSPYIPVIPSDPCTGSCLAEDGVTPLAYTYMAPAAVQYFSGGSNSSYQLSAVLQTGSSASGSTGGNVSTVDTLAPNMPANFHVSIVIGAQTDPVTHTRTDFTTFSWSPAVDNGFSGIAGYQVYLDRSPQGTPTVNVYGGYARVIGITSNSQTQCWSVASVDNAGNVSQPTSQQCFVDPPNTLPDTIPPSVPLAVTASRNGTTIHLQWSPSIDNSGGSGVARYQVYLGASLYTTVTTTSIDTNNLSISGGSSGGQYCWSVKAIDNSGNASAISSPAVCLY